MCDICHQLYVHSIRAKAVANDFADKVLRKGKLYWHKIYKTLMGVPLASLPLTIVKLN